MSPSTLVSLTSDEALKLWSEGNLGGLWSPVKFSYWLKMNYPEEFPNMQIAYLVVQDLLPSVPKPGDYPKPPLYREALGMVVSDVPVGV